MQWNNEEIEVGRQEAIKLYMNASNEAERVYYSGIIAKLDKMIIKD